jgi:hypothetical protein
MTETKKSCTKVKRGHFATRVQEEAERRAQDSDSEEYDWGCSSGIQHQPGASPPIEKEKAKRPKFSGTRRSNAEDLELTVASENVATTDRPPPSPQVASGPPSSPIQTPQSPTILQRMMSFGSPRTTSINTSHLPEVDSRKEYYLSDYEVTVDGKSTLTRRKPAGSFTL